MGSKQNLPDPTPYAQKDATQAESEGGREQNGAPNTLRSTKGAAIMPGPCNEVQVTPRSPDPYANTSDYCATREDSQADVSGNKALAQATYKTTKDQDDAKGDMFGHGGSDAALDPYGYGGDGRWS